MKFSPFFFVNSQILNKSSPINRFSNTYKQVFVAGLK